MLLNRLVCLVFVLERKPPEVHLDGHLSNQVIHRMLVLLRSANKQKFVFELALSATGLLMETEQHAQQVGAAGDLIDLIQSVSCFLPLYLFAHY